MDFYISYIFDVTVRVCVCVGHHAPQVLFFSESCHVCLWSADQQNEGELPSPTLKEKPMSYIPGVRELSHAHAHALSLATLPRFGVNTEHDKRLLCHSAVNADKQLYASIRWRTATHVLR